MSGPDRPSPVLLHNLTALDATGVRTDAWLRLESGTIQATGRGDGWKEEARGHEIVDGLGRKATPGFIDLHMHGGGGFSNEDGPDSILAAAAAHHRHGTTRSIISFVSSPIAELCIRVRQVAELTARDPLILGSHLEGPFLAPERKGAHNPAYLTDPLPARVERLLTAAAGTLRQITLDPARQHAADAIRAFGQAGVVVAVGHTAVGIDAAAQAFAEGASLLTHTFNGMAGIHHRAPGPVVAAIDNTAVTLELILDGEHVDPRVAALLFAAAPGRVALITDAMAAAAGGDGKYLLGNVSVEVRGGRALVAGGETLAGSTLTLDAALRTGITAGLPLPVLVEALTLTPARAMGLESRFGLLAAGYAADVVLFDERWVVSTVYGAGKQLC